MDQITRLVNSKYDDIKATFTYFNFVPGSLINLFLLTLDLDKSILLAPAKSYTLWKMVLSGLHGWISVVLILENGKNRLVTFGQRSIREATHIGMCFAIY